MRPAVLVMLGMATCGCASVEPAESKPFRPFEKPETSEMQQVMDRQSPRIEDRVREDERRIIDQ